VARFEPHDQVLWCPVPGEPHRTTILSLDGDSALIDLPGNELVPVPDSELYLLAPDRRPFMEDVERALARRFQQRVLLTVQRFWIDESRAPPDDDLSRLGLLKRVKLVRAAATEESQIAFADARTSLKAAYDPLLPELKVQQWCDQYRSWLEDNWRWRWLDTILAAYPTEPIEALQAAGAALNEQCRETAARLGIAEQDL
jgi:hypothetical protein